MNLYYIAFLELTTCRGSTYGSEGPVSWLTINEYAHAKEFEEEQREDLFFFMGRMDAAYLNFKTEKLKTATKPIGG